VDRVRDTLFAPRNTKAIMKAAAARVLLRRILTVIKVSLSDTRQTRGCVTPNYYYQQKRIL
jgi:hypothetical protein